jgi:hypothetical protein
MNSQEAAGSPCQERDFLEMGPGACEGRRLRNLDRRAARRECCCICPMANGKKPGKLSPQRATVSGLRGRFEDHALRKRIPLVLRPPESREGQPSAPTPAQALLRKMVLDSVQSPHTRRNYGKALDHLFAFCASQPHSRALLMEWRASMESLSPSTVNVRLSAVRRWWGRRRNGMIGSEEADGLTDIPNLRQQGTRLGNWLRASRPRNRWRSPTAPP